MILKSIRLHPFAGIRDKTFEFEEELNVVLGPNEAGKSTLFYAIWNGLLTPASLTARQLEQQMGDYFPAEGGDIIRLTLELSGSDGEHLLIRKNWKKGNRNGSASLQFANGTEITNEEEVQRKITELLPVSPATMKTLLLARQSELHRTIRKMEQENEVRKELGDLLRQNLMETDGVSVDRFRELLNSRYEEYFRRWDREQEYPENNRGINNPYKVNVGKVLQAYYDKEQLRKNLEEAREFESILDQVNERLSELAGQRNNKKHKFEELEPLKSGIARRKDHEQRVEHAELKKKHLIEINSKWPVLEDRIRNLEPQKKEAEQRIANLQGELIKAQHKQRSEQIESKIAKLKALTERVKDAHKELKEARKVEMEDVQEIRKLLQEISILKSRIEGARLTLRVQSDMDQTIGFREAGKSEEEIDAKQGSVIEKRASGGFTLIINGVKADVFSGDGGLERVVSEVSGKELELKRKLEELETDTLQSAESLAELYRQKQQQFVSVRTLYTSEAGDSDLETLQNELKELGIPAYVRSVVDINTDLVDAQTTLKSLEKDARDAESQLNSWKVDYGTQEKMLMELTESLRLLTDLNKELEQLPKLPAGYPSADVFIQDVELLDREIRQLEVRIHEIKLKKAEAERDTPEISSEELEKMAEEAVSDFQRIHKEGETLARVRARALELLERMDAGTYSGLEESFLTWLHQMSGNRFEQVEMNGDLPSLFKTDDGRPLTYALLSHGTKDTVALAWRFALTEHFLKEQKGFIILDDPMVDMDPARRKQASKAIEQFGIKHQVILLTCHPEHREGFENAVVVGM